MSIAEIDRIKAAWFPALIGKNATCVLHTRDCAGTYDALSRRGAQFTRPPQQLPYGVEAVFSDLYGNRYALVQPGG